MLTYQDFERAADRAAFLGRLIDEHEASDLVRTARVADLYDHQRNKTISEVVQKLFTASGRAVENYIASNRRRASNLFNRMNTQRNSFLLANGVTFPDHAGIKERLGASFDQTLLDAGYYALIHGVSFVYWGMDAEGAERACCFRVTEFAPLYDEQTGALRAGARYWRLDEDKPLAVVLYEADGLTRYRETAEGKLAVEREKRAYKVTVCQTPASGTEELVREENYAGIPVVPFWGSRLRQSTLVGLREGIDNYDLISNGWCNDLRDCAQVYWVLENFGGMNDRDLDEFRDRLITRHIAAADTSGGGGIRPYAQDVPYASREAYLNRLKDDLYDDFGAVNVRGLSAGSNTATAIRAAYEPLNLRADELEAQAIACVQGILALLGIEGVTPQFKRSMIVNEREEIESVLMERDVLGDEFTLKKLPNVTVDEIERILENRKARDGAGEAVE